MNPTMFQYNQIYGSGVAVWWSSRIFEWNVCRNSESPFSTKVSHQVSDQSNLWLRRCHLKNLKVATRVAIFDLFKLIVKELSKI